MGALSIVAAIIFACLFSFAPIAYADDACKITGESDPLICGTAGGGDEEMELMDRVSNVLNVIYLWIGIIAVVFIVIGGIKYMTSAGDANKVQGAKKTITYSVVGLVVVLAAFAITSFVIGALDGRTPDSGPVAERDDTIIGDKDRYKVRSITSINSTKLVAGQQGKIRARVVPDYATNKKLSYKSSNDNVVSVDNKGNIKAKKAGKATIIITSKDGVQKKVTVVIEKPIAVTSIALSDSKITVEKGKTKTIKATVTPNNAADKTLTWKTDNKKVATVTQTGTVKGIKDGEATITVSAFNQEVFFAKSDITLAAKKKGKLGTTIYKKIKVTVTSDPYETVGDQRHTKYNKRLDFRKETRKIVNKHNKDFYYYNYKSKIKSYGGYTNYVKNLGGIFTILGKEDKIKIKTAADFQAAFEYVWGLFTIWGPDYGGGGVSNHTHLNWGGNWGGTGGTDDGFYVGQPNRISYLKYDRSPINDMLRRSDDVRTGCNISISTFIGSTTLTERGGIANSHGQLNSKSKVGKIYYVDELEVGDVLGGTNDYNIFTHTFIVGEVYKDYVVAYEGGGRFITTRKFKKLIPRKHTKIMDNPVYGPNFKWYGLRIWNIDQSKTLKGLNE